VTRKSVIVATLSVAPVIGYAIGFAGALYVGTWSLVAKMNAFQKDCHGLPEPDQCRPLRAIIASDLNELIKFCKDLPDNPTAQATLKQAVHDFDLIHTAKSHYDFHLKIAGGPQWSSEDLVEPRVPNSN
jgi:hypothetical protein